MSRGASAGCSTQRWIARGRARPSCGDERGDLARSRSPSKVSTLSANGQIALRLVVPACRRRRRAGRSRAGARRPVTPPDSGPTRQELAIASRGRGTSSPAAASPRRVLGEHRDDRVDVAALPGVHVAPRRARAGRRRRASAASAAGSARAAARRPSLARRWSALLTDGDGRLERLRHLARGEAEHLAQDQHRALVRRQVLKRGDEGELDALALLVARLGRGVAVLERRALVGVGLDPGRLDQRPPGPSCGSAAGCVDGARAWAAARSRRGRCWWRSCRARSAASCGPRSAAARATPAASPPAARPRRRAPSRASGSSGRGARRGSGSTRLAEGALVALAGRLEQLPLADGGGGGELIVRTR